MVIFFGSQPVWGLHFSLSVCLTVSLLNRTCKVDSCLPKLCRGHFWPLGPPTLLSLGAGQGVPQHQCCLAVVFLLFLFGYLF